MAGEWKAADTQELLPYDLVESILAYLPFKSILRFRTVSKLWNQVICDPGFSNAHSRLCPTPMSSSFSTRFLASGTPTSTGASRSFCLINFSGERFNLDADLGAPFGDEARIQCYLNGLFLLSCKDDNYVLWNPYTGNRKTIPSIYNSAALGICHDPTTNDYKVVTINTFPNRFSIFSCNSRVWTKRNEELSIPWVFFDRRGGLYVDGACYWICYEVEWGKSKRQNKLLRFNGIDDTCEMVQLPASIKEIPDDITSLNLRGRFSLIYLEKGPLHLRIPILTLRKNKDGNAWYRITTVNVIEYVFVNLEERPPCAISDSLVLIFLGLSRYIVYDVDQETIVKRGKIDQKWLGIHFPCHESFIFPIFDVIPNSE